MVETENDTKLQVAIAGGGIGGLTAAIALLRHPRVSVQIYERAKSFHEIGAGISLGPNGLRTLERLGAENAISDDVCTRQKGDWPQIYRHWKTGEVLDYDVLHTVSTKKHFTARYHRAHLHQALLQNVPREIVHLGKKTVDVQVDSEKGVTLFFEDGTFATADICIGADGIHSGVRKAFVPDHELKFTGWVAIRSTFDSSLVRNVEYPEDASHWIGPDRSFFHGPLDKGQFTTVGGLHVDPSDPEFNNAKGIKWDDNGSMASLRDMYKDWNPAVRALLKATLSTNLYPNMAGGLLKTWIFNNRVTLVGDAAHTHGGAFAAGGSLAIDDAYAFSLALNHVWPASTTTSQKPTEEELARTFELYEETRKPHIDKILAIVHTQIIGKKMETGEAALSEQDMDDMVRERVRSRPDMSWINKHDVELSFTKAMARLGATPSVLGTKASGSIQKTIQIASL